MASHSAYPHVLHHHQHPQHGAHLPPPPPSSVGQAPNQRLPSLRSLNFAYPPVGEPGSAAIEGPSQPQQRGDQPPRTPFAQQEEYYHQREMPYYQDAASSSAHPGPAPPPAKRARSASNSGQRSPFAVQAHHVHSNSSSSAYQTPTHTHEAAARASASAGGYTQGHTQGNQQGHTQYAPGHQQPEPGHPPSSFFNRVSQPSPAWYYSTGHQPPQQQHPPQQQQQQQQHPTQQHPPQQHSSQQHPTHHPPVQHQHQHQHQQPHHNQQQAPPQPQNPAQKHPLHFQQYSAPAANPHSPHQAPGQAPPQPPRGSAASYPAQAQQQPPPQVQAHGASNASPTPNPLVGPGSAPPPATTTFGSPPTPGFATSGSGLSTGGARGADAKALGDDAERAAASGMHLSKITEHSTVLCEFANRYGQLPHMRPSPVEVAEMAQRATLVLQLVEHLRRMASAAGALQSSPLATFAVPALGERDREREKESGDEKLARAGSKKRPWEDAVAHQGSGEDAGAERSGEDNPLSSSFEMKDIGAMRSVADQDMAIIRSKRGQGAGGAGSSPGAPKAKYRKRSRATPPGKCHSCNIRETPEWRRGPDGARTLCNACGLHYAKLIRKRDKTIGTGADSSQNPIDLEMLRQSTRLAGEQPGAKVDGLGAFRDDMSEIQLQPVRAMAPQMGVTMQVHQWTPPGVPRDDSGYELGAYSTSLMRSSNARGSPA